MVLSVVHSLSFRAYVGGGVYIPKDKKPRTALCQFDERGGPRRARGGSAEGPRRWKIAASEVKTAGN